MKSKLICIALAAAFALTVRRPEADGCEYAPDDAGGSHRAKPPRRKPLYTYDGETPENAQPEVVYTSSDESIATVDENGIITGVAEGGGHHHGHRGRSERQPHGIGHHPRGIPDRRGRFFASGRRRGPC